MENVREHPFRIWERDVVLYAVPALEISEEISWTSRVRSRPFTGLIRMRDTFRMMLGRDVRESRLHPRTMKLLQRSAEVQMRLRVLAPVNAICTDWSMPQGFWEQQLGFPLNVDRAVWPGSVLFFSVPTEPVFGDPPLVYVGALHVGLRDD